MTGGRKYINLHVQPETQFKELPKLYLCSLSDCFINILTPKKKTLSKTRETRGKTFVVLFWRPEEFAGLQLQRLILHQHNHGWARKRSLILPKKKNKKKQTKHPTRYQGFLWDLFFFSNWFPVELARDQRWRVGDETRFSFHPPHWENNKYPFTLVERKRKGNHGNTFLFLLFSPQSFPWPDFIQAARWCWDFDTKPFDIAGRKKDAVTANNPQKRGRWLAMVIITAQARRVAWRARGGDNDRRKSSWWNQSWRKVIGRRLDGEERWRWSTCWREHELMARWHDFKCANV